jgi:hypothetical protein
MARPATRAITRITRTTWVSRNPSIVAKTILKNDFIGIFECGLGLYLGPNSKRPQNTPKNNPIQ